MQIRDPHIGACALLYLHFNIQAIGQARLGSDKEVIGSVSFFYAIGVTHSQDCRMKWCKIQQGRSCSYTTLVGYSRIYAQVNAATKNHQI